jgi:predicted TIM-barrel fold metal-dependent hydrolase
MIPLFDTLSHPTLSGSWLKSGKDAGFDALAASLEGAGYLGAAAVGIWGVEGYADEAFINACRRHPRLVPVAGFNPGHASLLAGEMQRLRALGYGAIKVHPRFTGLDLSGPDLGRILATAAEQDLIVFFCTYQHCGIERYPDEDPFVSLVRALKAAPRARVVLLHGGDVQLLRYAELVRFNDNLLLDLSLTIMKYEGSSLDADLRFLFQRFDRRISIGSDHPEYGHRQLRARFEELAADIAPDKAENIAFRNILSFIGREDLIG